MPDRSPVNVSDEVRFSPRAVDDDEWIETFLTREPMGVVGLVDEGTPYLVNQLFVYDSSKHAIFLHGANTGKTKTLVQRGDSTPACFTASRMGRLLPAEMPVDFDVEYASVVAFGSIRLIDGGDRKRRALERIMDKFAPELDPGEDYEPIADASIERTSVYRIDIDGWSGKRNDKPADFPGAYEYDPVQGASQ
ncbi:MAG: pyridoxamine 5'-phosphate oxidase family protein [Halobacteriota archaeon]|uniref:pyridoxamine 5'-phosphate oxidase family protein n=1 Tax=Natronomonas sp. TaxID=2184060 RepID=UPI0039752C9F